MSDNFPEMSDSFPEEHAQREEGAALTAEERAFLASKYDGIEEVGRGAMGIVYRARHKLLDKPVAIKICLTGSDADRFQREAQLLARLRSPHIVTVHDFDRSGRRRALLIMDWVKGRDLGKILKNSNEPLAEARVLPWMRQVGQGMQAAAAEGIIHRDLKPSNILIDERDCAHVSDFGLARSIHDARLTLTGGFMGTPYYMAPEQAEDPHRVDTRADIYSFGATYYHALTGQPPFQGETPFAILFKHKTEPLISPRARNPHLSSRISDCLERCLAKSPPERFSTFADLLTNLAVTTMSGSPWEAADEPDLMPYLQRYHQRRPIYLESPSRLIGQGDVYSFPQQRELRIAFPLLGTGAAGFPRDVCLDTMFRFLVRKLLHGLTSVREARIMLW